MLSQRQETLDNYLAQIPITPYEKGLFEMRADDLANAGAQDMDTNGYELSDLEDIEFFWKNRQVEMDAVFRRGIDAPFAPTVFNDLEMAEGRSSENAIVLDKKEDKEKKTLLEKLQSLSVPLNLPGCSGFVPLQDGLKKWRNLFIGLCLNTFIVCACLILFTNN